MGVEGLLQGSIKNLSLDFLKLIVVIFTKGI